MPSHYAITEAFITLAALWCAWKLFPRGLWMGAVGALLFGAAAAIGVYRFPSGQVEQLAKLHFTAGQLGGLAGMALIAAEFLRACVSASKRNAVTIGAFVAIALCVAVAWARPNLAVPMFLFWSVAAIAGAFLSGCGGVKVRLLTGLGAGAMLLNVIFIRQSPALGTNVSWHLFHALIAVWIVVIGFLCLRLPRSEPA